MLIFNACVQRRTLDAEVETKNKKLKNKMKQNKLNKYCRRDQICMGSDQNSVAMTFKRISGSIEARIKKKIK